jgi:signal transduction histidine kinase
VFLPQLETTLNQACREYLWDNAPVLAVVLDSKDRVTAANKHAHKVLGAALVGMTASALTVDFDGGFSPRKQAREKQVRLVHFAARDGVLVTYQVSCFELGDSTLLLGATDGDDLAFGQHELVALNDELGNLTRELARKNAELARLDEIKNRFLGMAAHDLRKPVGAMLTYSEFLIDEATAKLNEEQQRFLGIIHASCDFMSRLIDDFLDIAVIESGKLTIQYATVAPAAIIAGSLAVAEVHARRKGVTCQVDAPPQPHIQADAPKMEQVLNNLVLNAIEHSKPGDTILISTSIANDAWTVVVKDRGTGISPSDLARLFSPFESGSVPKTAGERSTGLGLAIAKKIVEGHGGTISVESTPGAGTTFTVRIPVARRGKP